MPSTSQSIGAAIDEEAQGRRGQAGERAPFVRVVDGPLRAVAAAPAPPSPRPSPRRRSRCPGRGRARDARAWCPARTPLRPVPRGRCVARGVEAVTGVRVGIGGARVLGLELPDRTGTGGGLDAEQADDRHGEDTDAHGGGPASRRRPARARCGPTALPRQLPARRRARRGRRRCRTPAGRSG